MKKLVGFVAAALFIVASPIFAAAPLPSPVGFVNDYAGVLTQTEKDSLETKLRGFAASTSNEVAVVIVPSLEGDYIEHYASQLFASWKIGTDKRDNGVLMLIAIGDRKMRIEVGYGLEGVLTDSVAAMIIRDDLTPAFKQSKYYDGINAAINDIIDTTQGEYVGDKTIGINAGIRENKGYPLQLVIFFFLMTIQLFAAMLGRSKSWWFGGILGGFVGVALTYLGWLGASLLFGGVVTFFLVLVGLLFDFVVSQKFEHSLSTGTPIPWWVGGNHIGGTGSSGNSGGGSFGGFGGGSSGGGGASGSW